MEVVTVADGAPRQGARYPNEYVNLKEKGQVVDALAKYGGKSKMMYDILKISVEAVDDQHWEQKKFCGGVGRLARIVELLLRGTYNVISRSRTN